MWRLAKGKIEIDNGVRVVTDADFCRYYQKLIWNWNHKRTQLPAFGAHVTIYNPKIHGEHDLAPALYLNGLEVTFWYHLWIIQSPRNYFVPVNFPQYHEIRWQIGFQETKDWWGRHLTICNTKFAKLNQNHEKTHTTRNS